MNQYITGELKEDELVYAITVSYVQKIAKERIGRELTFDEMQSVKKGIEWGMIEWDNIVATAIDNAIEPDSK